LHRIFIVLTISILVTACTLQRPSENSTLQSTSQHSPILVQETIPTSEPDSLETDAWQVIDDGLAWRVIEPNGIAFAQMNILRIDPTIYGFRAVYTPQDPKFLGDWESTLDDPVAIINANFFESNNTALGIIVSDGIRFGDRFRRTGGTFIIENGIPSIRGNITQPYSGQPVEQAIEGFPLLVENGQSVHTSNNRAQRTRRTVIAQDSQDNILLIVSPFLGLSLPDLSQYLATSDLDIVHALNLDGGGSSMMSVQAIDFRLGSFDPVPAILAVYKR